jgi:hypothetical protein
MSFDFKNMQTYHYFIIGGGGLAVIAFLLYCFTGGAKKVSAGILIGLGCLIVGFGAGVLTLSKFGYEWTENLAEKSTAQKADATDAPPIEAGKNDAPKGVAPKAMMPKGGGGMMGGMSRGPNSKAQLVSLVTKLSQLTEKPLSITLNEDRKKKVAEQIKDLETLDNLSDDEASKRLKALLDVVKDDRESMESAGFTCGGGFGPRKDDPNPFKSERNSKTLKALQDRVATK